jgi:hypothetical protein
MILGCLCQMTSVAVSRQELASVVNEREPLGFQLSPSKTSLQVRS